MPFFFLPLKERREIAPGTMEFVFDTAGSGYTFRAGQHASFTLIHPPHTDAEGNTRTFGFCTAPAHAEYFTIAMLVRPTAYKDSLETVPLGTKVRVSPALGDFVLHGDGSKPAVFLAEGIGITTFAGMAEDAALRRLPQRIYLFYSNPSKKEAAYFNELQKWEGQNPNFRFIPTLTGPPEPGWAGETGPISAAMLRQHVPDLASAVCYVAGIPESVARLRKILAEAGVKEADVKVDEFTGY
ncbi:MAG: FAD-dependent oxidoreductase [Candidatus Micrarchaeota archaeon]|nr:FAD-dependent oxidoreductase [Candidatus Micrarchaeota archaeon]